MNQGTSEVDRAVAALLPGAAGFLREILAFESVEGKESGVQEAIARGFGALGLCVTLEAIPDSIKDDPEFTPGACAEFEGRPNVVALRRGTGSGRSLIVNTHSDVVPAGGWAEAFSPKESAGVVTARGAADAKGQIAAIYLAVAALDKLGVDLSGDLEIQVVIDEEVGGNGTLSLLRTGHTADAAVVMEPTSLSLHPANRGALWFRFTVSGEAGHMARKHEVPSAIDHTIELINILYRHETHLLERARSNALFAMHDHPVQVNIGSMHAGEWPATVAAQSVIEGGVGFLPGMTIDDVKRELAERVDREASPWLRANHSLEFPGLHNDAFETPPDSPAVKAFQAALSSTGLDPSVSGWTASCDARLFSKVGGIDTIVFGPGDLSLAHSNDERIPLAEIETAARALVRFVIDWCG